MQNQQKINITREFPAHLRLPQYKKIEKIIEETEDIKTFFFRSIEIAETAHPGQFLMVYIFNYLEEEPEEIPISLSYIDRSKQIIGISVRKAGSTTKALHKHKNGDLIGVRGPYGCGYKVIGNKIAIIGGGIGMAPLMPLLEDLRKNGNEVDVFLGALNQNHLCFIEQIKNTGATLYVTTDDGSAGFKGFVTDILEKKIREQKYDHIMTAGPELMLKKILNISNKFHIPLQASLERYIKCGRGICGQCAINDLRICTEGPVFTGSVLNNLSDFGKFAMDETGELKPISNIFHVRKQP
jgi:dihydroorotate dehydrogenase electron transfer subunit